MEGGGGNKKKEKVFFCPFDKGKKPTSGSRKPKGVGKKRREVRSITLWASDLGLGYNVQLGLPVPI